ncbi:unnamed protein product [Rotaria magnacalcarata]|uniref:Uncharacterized protein n=1 Tax=Rotaria magnacalcarata TaxID=392030 RepID=A0A816ZNF4_9BILA|nr:unnamed protein product [Rotaria magnacalcarata]
MWLSELINYSSINFMVRYLYKMLTRIWYRHQKDLDECIIDLEIIINNQEHEMNELRSQLDKYQSVNESQRNANEHHRSGVPSPLSMLLCSLIIWEKVTS